MFIQPDWFDVMKPGVGTNRFSYSFNDPINKADANGNQEVTGFGYAIESYYFVQGAGNQRQTAQTYWNQRAEQGAMQSLGSVSGLAGIGLRSAVTWAASKAPSSTIFGLEMGTAEATGMSVGVGLAAKGSTIAANAASGLRRGAEALAEMKTQFPNASIQHQQYLRNADGKIEKDPLTKEGRRLDFVAIENGTARQVREVTTMTAPKGTQIAKETNIINSGGHYVRDRTTRQLVNLSNKGIFTVDRRP
jgi:hypothetical protein